MKHETREVHSAEEMQKVGALFAGDLLSHARPQKHATAVALQGELGSGKTTFAQGFAAGLGITEKVLSPTFVIVKSYKIPDTRYKIQNMYHIDCYRLQTPADLQDLGWLALVSNPRNIILLEWPALVQSILPESTIYLSFDFINESTRQITSPLSPS
jgi:tRNA threonylcarbamoyladenosine biosynthesis protein TsaE